MMCRKCILFTSRVGFVTMMVFFMLCLPFYPGYGMFTNIDETHCVWLNSSSLESEKEFELVGILLGLAIYNGIILDVHFPLVIYKKLQGEKLDLHDLMSIQPSLARSLMELLHFVDRKSLNIHDIHVTLYMLGMTWFLYHLHSAHARNLEVKPQLVSY